MKAYLRHSVAPFTASCWSSHRLTAVVNNRRDTKLLTTILSFVSKTGDLFQCLAKTPLASGITAARWPRKTRFQRLNPVSHHVHRACWATFTDVDLQMTNRCSEPQAVTYFFKTADRRHCSLSWSISALRRESHVTFPCLLRVESMRSAVPCCSITDAFLASSWSHIVVLAY